MSSSPSIADVQATEWDAIVVGTGVGGATAGYELARRGKRVLFIEKGPFLHGGFPAAPSGLSESVVAPAASTAPADLDRERFGGGRWPHYVTAHTNLGRFSFYVPVGCASGGSSAFYAAAMERFTRADFEPGANAGAISDTTLPDSWPVSYDEFEPWYAEAEKLYRVRGTPDPLHGDASGHLLSPPDLNARDRFLVERFKAQGLNPYQLHVACEFVDGCQGCLDGPCQQACKRDSAWTCLIPALAQHKAVLLPETEVASLQEEAGTIRGVVCRRGDEEVQLTARVVILAAGAFATPALLLRSGADGRPQGLANSSGCVGRNLMFHGGDLFALSPGEDLADEGVQKTLALNDFYSVDGIKFGTFQSMGTRLDIGQVMQYLRDTAEYSAAWWSGLLRPRPVWWRKLTSPFIRLGALVYFHLFRFSRAAVWVSIVEDLPYHHNRVYPSPDDPFDIIVEYQYSDELRSRVLRFRKMLKERLGSLRLMVLTDGKKIDYPHVCGTCRFGDDPATSVLDRNNRAHDVDNLYVVDASFFPSSGGTNPSLTIAANALRVAGIIDADLQRDSR